MYCPRNYCALLLRIYEITEDKNVIAEYYYTAKHFAKLYLNITVNVKDNGTYDERIYYTCNTSDLKAIIADKYEDYEKMICRIETDSDISKRQKSTIIEGIKKLKESIEQVNFYMNIKV